MIWYVLSDGRHIPERMMNMAWKKQFTPEERAAYQAEKRAEIEDIFKRIDAGVQRVFTSEKYRDYLKFMSRFTDYSARNTLLIAMQKPDATLVAAYGKWKQLGRQVSKGESGIEILAPVAYKTGTVEEIERPVVDEFGNRQYNPDGTEKTEIIQNPVMDIAFRKAYVFDVSQTTGKEIPVPVSDLSGELDSDKMAAILKALQRVTGIEIQFADIPGGAKGYYSPADNQIVVQSGMSDAQTLKTAFHECAHKLLHDPDLKSVTTKSARNEKEVQAESTAFIVAERMALDTSEYSFPYIASWSDGKQLDQLTKVLDEIQHAAKRMSSAIDSELLKLQKRDLTIEEMLADTDLDNIQKAEILVDDCRKRGIVFCRQDENAILQYAGAHEDISDTVRLISDMEMTMVQIPEMEAPQDISQAEYVAEMGFDTFNRRPKEAVIMKEMQRTDHPKKPETLGNTPFQVLCRSQVQYFKGLKPRHAENIAKQLDADGIAFSGVRKENSVTLTVRKVDVPQYEAAVAKVKAVYSQARKAAPQQALQYFDTPPRKPQKPITEQRPARAPKDVPIVTNSFVEARQNNRLDELWDSINASKACRDFIDKHLYDAYENRDLKGFVQQLEEQFGMERTMYTLAATVQLKSEDGHFTPEVKKEAARFSFESDQFRLRFLTEQHPVRLNHLYEVLIDRAKELAQAQAKQPELPKLSDYLSGQFLLSTERVTVRDDYRGIPETKYFHSSVNEYFADGIGWLNEDAYDREQKLSDESPNQFYSKVSKINADCINPDGAVSKIDMTRQEYELMTAHTYAPENRQALAMAKAKLAELKEGAGIRQKPTEQYAVRQSADHRYSVVTISADGLVTPVIPDLKTVPAAKKALLTLYEQRSKTARCELVHPQVLDEKSAALYTAQEELPQTVYRIQLSREMNAPDTHYVQEYIKNSDDSYKVGKVMARGDYFACNIALGKLIAPEPEMKQDRFMEAIMTAAAVPPAPTKPEVQAEREAEPTPPAADFVIYQLKGGDETRDLRFEPYDRLTQQGQKPDIANYDLIYEGSMADVTDNPDLRIQLEAIFRKFNLERPDDFTGHSLSVSDVVVVRDQAFYVDSFGFKPLPDFLTPAIAAPELTEQRFLDALPGRLQAIAEHTVSPAEDNLLKVSAEAEKLRIDPSIMRKAAEMVDDPRIDRMAETYVKRFETGNPQESQQKPKPKKPKL